MKTPALSPMMQQYMGIKEQYKDAILMYRLGDFYEMFFDDAITASNFLDLTLTGRDCGLSERAPMCGVPYHAVDNYIKRLIEGGFKVAICEQLNTPEDTKGQLDRDVVRVISAGTLVEDSLLDEKTNNFIASVYVEEEAFGLAWADMSTGEFNLYEYKGENYDKILFDLLVTVSPSQIIMNGAAKSISVPIEAREKLPAAETFFDWAYLYANAEKRLLKQLNTATLMSYECADKKLAVSAAGALVEYLVSTQKRELPQFVKLSYIKNNTFMLLDANTRRNLELTASMHENRRRGSLLWMLDKTSTGMGARKLKNWIEQPLTEEYLINNRLNGVEELYNNRTVAEDLKAELKSVRDIERLSSRLAYGKTNPRDLLSLKESLAVLPRVRQLIKGCKSKIIKGLFNDIYPNAKLVDMLENSIDENASAVIKDGRFIRKGYNKTLDEYRGAGKEGKKWLIDIETAEKEATGIKNLKVGYNKVFGYYIEVSKSQTDMVPLRYQRKQTLVNGERYITEELKDIEDKIINAEENSIKLELQLFAKIIDELSRHISEFLDTAAALSTLDCLLSLSDVAVQNKYCKPIINEKIKHISIKNGRHPIVEVMSDDVFVPNDTMLDDKDNRCMTVTGPNMAGKSTYMRQVALITLMAHIGSFVPADSAEISLTDRIFTRVGASDDISLGQSTFMVEMVEVATILNNATPKSLLILDEIGRGTSTLDGLSIAWAVMENISRDVRAKTLFATHFHELCELEGVLEGVKNYQILIKEIAGKVVFLHKIVRGGASKSFGIEVAGLAGVPVKVIDRAKVIMKQLEEIDINRDTNSIMMSAKVKKAQQMSFLNEDNQKEKEIMGIINDLNIENCSPMQAFAILMDLKEKAGR